MKARYIIGIDLGTTNSAVGYVDLHESSPGAIRIHTFEIPQLTGHGRVGRRPTLPSFLYLPGEYDLRPEDTALPWARDRRYVVGVFARDQGLLVPGRLVSSAKSWLCHGGVDRQADILPWGAGEDVPKVSPVKASARYLQHIREAWDHTMPEALERQTIILTVPASFDEIARELTLQAAKEAGLPGVTLLDEPLAAFYSWLSLHEDGWKEHLSPGDLLLVCDVGGGTTDFTLISCREGQGGPLLERVAVGDHLLLGGDNMDLALSVMAERKLKQELDPARWQSLVHQCRQAKEGLLEAREDTAVIRLAGRGRSLVGGTVVVNLHKDQVKQALLEGFFPMVEPEQAVREAAGETGIREMGLPYVSDPAVTRHLARFLLRQGQGRMPTVILFNGGALKPGIIRERLLRAVSSWKGSDVRALESRSLDLAISWGAAYYGLVRLGLGLKVGGGSARAYYIGVGSRGDKEGAGAVCLVERGTEEDQEVELSTGFHVLANRPVKFSLYSSTTRTKDRAGDVVELPSRDLVKLPPLHTVLRFGKKGRDVRIPVVVGARVTAIGTLEVYCKSRETPHRWRLQFNLRESEQQGAGTREHIEGVRIAGPGRVEDEQAGRLTDEDKEAIEAAGEVISRCFARDGGEAVDPSDLPRILARATGQEKEMWSLPVLRAMAERLLEHKQDRGRSPRHEARWLNLTGFCMRPGTGEINDPWRIKKIWPLFFEGLVFPRDQEARLQWWIFWRRVAGGLGPGQQAQLFATVSRVLIPAQARSKKRRKKRPLKVGGEEKREIWLVAANLERLGVQDKVDLGEAALRLALKERSPWSLWVLSRVGARQPLYGPVDRVVHPGRVASWLEQLRRPDWKRPDVLARAVVSMARLTGDRTRDLSSRARQELVTFLQALGVSQEVTRPLAELVPVEVGDKARAFGESLPEGLSLGEGPAERG